jgi:hypothetical protein
MNAWAQVREMLGVNKAAADEVLEEMGAVIPE